MRELHQHVFCPRLNAYKIDCGWYLCSKSFQQKNEILNRLYILYLWKSHILSNQMSFAGVSFCEWFYNIWIHSGDMISSGSQEKSSLMLRWTKASSCLESLEETMVATKTFLAWSLNNRKQMLSCVSCVTCRSYSTFEPYVLYLITESAHLCWEFPSLIGSSGQFGW